MPFYIQRRDGKSLETIEEFTDSREAYRVAKEYNMADTTATHYVTRRACKAWYESFKAQ